MLQLSKKKEEDRTCDFERLRKQNNRVKMRFKKSYRSIQLMFLPSQYGTKAIILKCFITLIFSL